MTRLAVLGATGPFGTRVLASASRHDLEIASISERTPSERLVALAELHPGARIVITGAAPAEERELAHRLGDRVSFGGNAETAAATDPGMVVANGQSGLTGLAASVAALEAGNRLVAADPAVVARSGRILPNASARGGGELVVTGPAWAVRHASRGIGPTGSLGLTVVGDGGPLQGMSHEEVERFEANDVAHARIDRAICLDAAYALIGAHLLCDTSEVSFGVHAGVWDAVVSVDGSTWGHAPEETPLESALLDLDTAAGSLAPLERPPRYAEPNQIGREILAVAMHAVADPGTALAAFGAASDVGVRAFVERRIGLASITEIVERTVQAMPDGEMETISDVGAADREARELATSLLGGMC